MMTPADHNNGGALLTMRNIGKRFPGVVALKGVSLSLGTGELLALMGENGAGKSTLVKILGGILQPDEGEICIAGKPALLNNVKDSKAEGVAIIHQELLLAPNLDIASNLFLGSEDAKSGLLSPLQRARMNARAVELMAEVGLTIPVSTAVSQLSVGQMQMVEIAKALSGRARIIVMDEPTASLTSEESDRLFQIIARLKQSGMSFIYISHRMPEVMALADRIAVLRDGTHVGELERAEATQDRLIAMMVGRELSRQYFPKKSVHGAHTVRLEVRGLVVPGSPEPVSFTAHEGEIVGFAGLIGAGRTELMAVLFGISQALEGQMFLDRSEYAPKRPRDAIAVGVYLAPEDRKRHGLVLPMTVAENISLPSVTSRAPLGRLDRKSELATAASAVQRLNIKTHSAQTAVVNLSGGNQQKVVLAKWLALSPKVLIVDEPTRGIDVGAKAEIYRLLVDLAKRGVTVLMVSSDLEEVVGLSDRVVVLHERRLKGILERHEITPLAIAGLMTGRAPARPNKTGLARRGAEHDAGRT